MSGMGSGQVYSHEDRPIIHFGSPAGSKFWEAEERVAADSPVDNTGGDSDASGLGVA